MRRTYSLRLAQVLLVGAIIGVVLLTSACGGDSHLQQQASQARAQVDQQIKQALSIGVPVSSLQSFIQQKETLNNSSAPFNMFDDTPANAYYKKQISSYQQLLNNIQEQVSIVTGQYQGTAQQSLANFKQALTAQQSKKFGNLQVFSLRYTTDENKLAAARYPKDYLAITTDTQDAVNALNSMNSTYGHLAVFKNAINQMQKAHLDVAVMQSEYTSDLAVFNAATSINDFHKLDTILNAQYQMAVVSSIEALPYVGTAKLQEFQNQITQLNTYGMDSSSYVKLYNTDKTAMSKASTIAQYLTVSNQIDQDMATMHDDLVKGASWYLIKELDKQAHAWGQTHLYHDKFDGKSYILDSAYTMDGIGYWLQRENGWSYTTSDYQSVVDDDQNEFFNFQMMQQDYNDPTPYNQIHQTDREMMQHYPDLQHGTVIMVNMIEEALRFYIDGKLVNSFQITAGRVERPTLPGVWTTQDRKSPDEFKSDDPPNSPFWYPPTHINYAILYHWGGFFVHDAWWRVNFGPGTQFPHYDQGGDEAFAGSGSHGCVNVPESQAGWLYAHTDWSTRIVIY